MSNLKTGKPTEQEEAESVEAVVEQETSKADTDLVEHGGEKYLSRKINGLTIKTRIA